MEVHYITDENYAEAYDAIRDILYLYDDMVTSYARFGHNLEVGKFDAFRSLSAVLDEPLGYTFGIDLDLIHKGSAIALLCHLSDYWDEFEGKEIGKSGITKRIKNYLDSGLFDCVELAKKAAIAAYRNETEMRNSLEQVYHNYVIGYYQTRLNDGITSRSSKSR